MKSFPQKRTKEQTVTLGDWLAQWHLDRKLRECPEQDVSLENQGKDQRAEQDFGRLIRPFSEEPVPEVSQIRLLSPSLISGGRGPTYVAVLGNTGTGCYLVAPFSRFQTPALPFEILLRDSPAALSVLCLWNARSISAFVLSQSWCVSQLSEAELQDALAICNLADQSNSIPETLASRVGPPVCDLEDPRLEYMDEEGEMWREIVFFPAEAETGVCLHIPSLRDVSQENAMQLAADSTDPLICILAFEVKLRRLFVHVFAKPAEKMLFLVVSDSLGESSSGLDGIAVSLRGIGVVGQFKSGQSLIHAEDLADIALIDPAGVVMQISKIENPL